MAAGAALRRKNTVEAGFPPLFEAREIRSGDALRQAVARAARGAGAGTLLWSGRDGTMDVAVLFEPDRPLTRAWPAALVAGLALADALEAAGPERKPVMFGWPDRLQIDGARVGTVRAACPPGTAPDAVPDWLAVAVSVRLGRPGEECRTPDRTTLWEEGFGEVEPGLLAPSYARHLLHWVHRWQEDGFRTVAEVWLDRLAPSGDETKHGLDPDTGDLLRLTPGTTVPERRRLAEALGRGGKPETDGLETDGPRAG
ncbi:MAG TPA: biotin/lipoate--protein ligase family protein [Azospirillaceae bacterium]|nr:biotin/lipoate--protein ligase family protein [Azospirillaceae bacterium]